MTILNENPVDETQEICVLRVGPWHRGMTPVGGDGPSALELLKCVCVPKGSEVPPHHRLSLHLPGVSPGGNHSTLIILDHCFPNR